MKGKFITIEGIDGSGKSTVIKYINNYLGKLGYDIILTREPGGTEISENIRKIIVNKKIDIKTEALLFAASRREHVVNKIIPALKNNKIIISDRFLDSSIAYQVYGRGLKKEDILYINNFAIEGLTPDFTIYLDVDIDVASSRLSNRLVNNVLDNENKKFYNNVKKGYVELLKKYSNRICVVDANKDQECVKEIVIKKIQEKFKEWQIN